MGDLEKTVKIFFRGVDDVSKPLGTMSSKINKFSSDVSKIGSPFSNITKGVIALDAAIAAMVAGGLAYSINQFATFEDRMLKVKGVLGANQEEYAKLTELTKHLGATTRYTAEEAASGLEFLALAGMSTAEAMEALPRVLELAQASGLALKDTADIVTNIMAGYGIETNKLASTNDVLTATFTNSNTSLHQLGEAFKFVGPVAKSLGFSIEETAATLGILGNAGYQAEKGGTALRNIMLALVAPAGNMGKLMKELGVNTSELGVDFASSRNALDSLGVSIKDSSGNIRPFTDILAQIKTGLEKIPDEADRTATLIEIFGKRGGPQMAALLSQGTEAIDGLKGKINSLGGVTGDIAAEMESGMGGIKRALRSAFDSIFIEIGEKSAEAISKGANSLVELMRVISKEVKVDTFKPLFDVLAELSEEMGKTLDEIAKNLPEALDGVEFSGLAESLRELAEVFSGAFDDVDLTSVKGLEAVIQKVVNGLSGLTSTTTGIAEVLVSIGKKILGVADSLGSLDDEQWEIVGNLAALGTALTGLASVIAVGGALVAGISAFAGLFSSGGIMATAITGAIALFTGPFGLAASIAAIAAAVAKFSWDSMNKDHSETMDKMEKTRKKIQTVSEQIKDLPSNVSTIEIWAAVDRGELDEAQRMIDELTGKKHQVDVKLNTDNVKEDISWADDINKEIWIDVNAPMEKFDKTIEKLKEIPTEKIIEIKAQGEIDKYIAKVEADANTVQAALEWKAKVDISELDMFRETTVAAFDSIGESVAAVTSSTTDMFRSVVGQWNELSGFDQNVLMREVEKQQQEQSKLTNSLIALNDAQSKMMVAKAEAIEKGDGEIRITADGLIPSLKMVLFDILRLARVEVNELNEEFLLGIDA